MSKTYKSDMLAALHETVSDMHDAGLMDQQTMRHFDGLCLTPIPDLAPDEIKAIRLKSQVSQSVFAHYLNVSPGIVSQWERGEKHPSGASLKLLVLVRNKGLEVIA
jgi:putative transcriptional regulator